jgi:hypothetical protein
MTVTNTVAHQGFGNTRRGGIDPRGIAIVTAAFQAL